MGRGKIKGCDPFCKDPKRKSEYLNELRSSTERVVAPTDSDLSGTGLSKKDKHFQRLLDQSTSKLRQGGRNEGYKPQTGPRKPRGLDQRGLSKEATLRVVVPKMKTELHDGQSLRQFRNKLREEEINAVKVGNKALAEAAKGNSERRKLKLKERKLKHDERRLLKRVDRDEEARFRGEQDDVVFGDTVDRPPSFDDIALPAQKQKGGRMSNLEILNKALAEAAKKAKAAEAAASGGAEDDARGKGKRGSRDEFADVRRHLDSEAAEAALVAEEKRRAAVSFEQRQAMLAQARADLRRAEIERARAQAQLAYRDMKAKSGRGGRGFAALTGGDSQLRSGAQVAQRRLESVDGPQRF